MTGKQMFFAARSVMGDAGIDPALLNREMYVDNLNYVMRQINDDPVRGAPLYVARNISVPTVSGSWTVRPRMTDGSWLTVRYLLRASYDGVAIRIDAPMDFPGPEDTGTTVETGSPENVWIEQEHWGGPSGLPVSEQVWGFYPKPDAVYTVVATAVMPLPSYDDWSRELPIRRDAHSVIENAVLARLFSTKRLHNQVMQGHYLSDAMAGINTLRGYGQRQIVLSQPPLGPEDYEQQ